MFIYIHTSFSFEQYKSKAILSTKSLEQSSEQKVMGKDTMVKEKSYAFGSVFLPFFFFFFTFSSFSISLHFMEKKIIIIHKNSGKICKFLKACHLCEL